MAFSQDSRWAVVSTLNGTTHIFPISPYGGEPTVRTHTSSKVVNKMSRFQTSAGIDSILNLPQLPNSVPSSVPKSSQSHSVMPSQPPPQVNSLSFLGSLNSYNNWNNPRSLPLPTPVSISALQQIKQPYFSLQGGQACLLKYHLLSSLPHRGWMRMGRGNCSTISLIDLCILNKSE